MKIILLSGGSGKRLWPLSNDIRSKQFLKILRNPDGEYESMVQRVYRQIRLAGIQDDIILATGEKQVDSIKNQLGDAVDIVVEPERRDTFPAIALACAYLKYEKLVDDDEAVLVLPVDSYTDNEFFMKVKEMGSIIQKNLSDILLLGIHPTYPSAKYGYILPQKSVSNIQMVSEFREKPSEDEAEDLINRGAVWNGGVFGFRLKYMISLLNEYIPYQFFSEISANYHKIKRNSFDYEVVEQAKSVAMLYYDGAWKDLGTWNTLSEEMEEDIGRVYCGENTENTQIINELGTPVVVLGVKNLVIVAAPDGILVSDKESSSYLKPYVEQFTDRPYYEEKSWGESKILEINTYESEEKNLVSHLVIHEKESYRCDNSPYRYTNLNILCGYGTILLNGQEYELHKGDIVQIKEHDSYHIETNREMHIIKTELR